MQPGNELMRLSIIKEVSYQSIAVDLKYECPRKACPALKGLV